MKILFVDTETSGLPIKDILEKKYNYKKIKYFEKARLVSIAWILYDECTKEEIKKNYIIKPENFIISDESIAVHKITNEIATAEGISFDVVMKNFIKDIDVSDIIVAHNIDFDKAILKSEFLRRNKTRYIKKIKLKEKCCTMKLGSLLNNLIKWPTLFDLYKLEYNLDAENLHNAESDVFYCKECWTSLKNKIDSRISDVEETTPKIQFNS